MNISKKIIGERITLKAPERTEKLALSIFEAVERSKDVFKPWLGWAETYKTIDDAYKFIDFCIEGWNNKKQYAFGIFFQENFVGVITVLHIDEKHNRAEIGYWQDVKYSGNGYIQEAVKLVEIEFFNKGFNKLIIHTDVLNEKSANVARRLLYVHEGVLRQQIYSPSVYRYRDQNVFSKLKTEWENDEGLRVERHMGE